jgi:hypothetical protein
MRADLQSALVRDFPELCKDYGGDMRQTCMAWGFEVGDGWEPLLWHTLDKLGRLEPPPVLDQVKEKYGGLRIYFHGGPPRKRRWFGLALWPLGFARALWWAVRYRWHGWRHILALANSASYWPHDDPARDIVDAAERESYHICESCGKPGHPNVAGWISTLCSDCRKGKA